MEASQAARRREPWGSWCDACESEASRFSATAAEYHGRARFLGVDVQDKHAAALSFLRRYHQRYDSVQSSGSSVSTTWGLIGLRETFFGDSRGRTIAHAIGAMTHGNLRLAVDALLTVDSAATHRSVG